MSAPMSAVSPSRRAQACTLSGCCTLRAASGRSVGTTRVARLDAAIFACQSSASEGIVARAHELLAHHIQDYACPFPAFLQARGMHGVNLVVSVDRESERTWLTMEAK